MKVSQPQKPSARPGLLLAFLIAAVVIITMWYREGTTGPLHRIRLGTQAATAPVSAAGEFLTRPVRGFFSWASDLGVSRSQLEQLRKQNAQLRLRVAQLEEARLENDRLRGLLDVPLAKDQKSLGAHVIGRQSNSWEGVITIDRGTADKVKSGMPVIGPKGLLGQTVGVTRHTARVQLITDPLSRVAAMVQSTRAQGIVRGSLEGRLSLDFVSRNTTVTAGDMVITSGMGGVYPKGLIIGEVTSVKSEPSALYKSITIEPPAGIGGLEEVAVLLLPAASTDVGGGE